VVPIVRAHHEKWDGSGYPHGIKGEEIPIGARILAAVDCLDALASDRQYRRALPLDEAMKVVQKESGTSFDPRVVEVLSKHYVRLEKMAKESRAADPMKLSKDVKVERGLAPAAGFEAAASNATTTATPGAQAADFLSLIAGARQEVQALFEISQDLGNSLSLDETLSLLGVRLRRIVPHHGLAIWVQRAGILMPEFVAGDDFRLFSSLQIPVGQGLSGWVAENRKAILNGNPSVESGYLNDPTKFSALRSALAVPLEGTGGVVGVLTLYHTDRDAFTKDHLRILLAINGKIAISIENALRFRQAETSATTDYLTGLPNARSLFLQFDAELSRSRRSEKPIAVLAMDLNGFKQVNDRCGHLEGNRALRAVGAALKSVCREYDQVARMGGDEFVMVLPGARAGEISAKFEQIRSAISQVSHEMFAGQMLSASIGAAYFPEDGNNADELLSVADRRMYSEKQSQRRDTKSPSRVLRERDEPLSALVN
jgi:diguanylate cyclase (GGDEF)-like protein